MHCQTEHPYLRNKQVQINDVWEVIISIKVWMQIRKIAKERNCSYTTITRYCAFRLAEKEKLRWIGK